MRAAIFGFTEFGKYINDLLLYQHTIGMGAVCFVDNDKSKQGQKYESVEVINADELQKRYKHDIDIVIIGVLGVHRSLFPIIMQLRKMGIKDVYFIPNHYFYYKRLFNKSRNFLLETCVYCGDLDKPVLPYLEMHVADHCNLNCKACVHFSPLFSGGGISFPSIALYERDLKRMKDLFSLLPMLRLLGGEPLLNPELEKYIEIARGLLPYADLRICTNGLLLPKMNEGLINCIRKNKVIIDISCYKPTMQLKGYLQNLMEANGLAYEFLGDGAVEWFDIPLAKNLDESWVYSCPMDYGCTNVRDGKASRCPLVMYISKFNETFGLDYPQDGLYDIYAAKSGEELQEKLKEKFALCKYCIKARIPWEVCGKEKQVGWWAVSKK